MPFVTAPRLILQPLALAASFLIAGAAQAQSLQELYDAARGYDATYLAIRATADAAAARIGQAEALNRPSLGLGASATAARSDPPTSGAINSTTIAANLQGKYSVYNAANAPTIDKARRAYAVAQADLESAEQDLMVRLATAYFDVLAAKDALSTTRANKAAIAEQLASAKRNFEVGTATITDTREAQAKYDLAVAQELAADNDLRVKRVVLDQFVGRVGVEPKGLAQPVALPALNSENIDTWVSAADEQHPAIRKARLGLELAQLDTQIARAGEKPTLDASATVGANNVHNSLSGAASVQAGAGTSKNATIGLTFTYPLYTGGLTQNRIKETLVLEEKARNDLDFARRSVAEATRRAFFGVQSLKAQVAAYEAAESSTKLALEATQLGYKVGVRVNLDVLNAQTQLYSTQRDLAKARYDVLVNSLKLRQASGQLRPEDINATNALLAK
ncbi:TolC family outer membrane protein [Roseateles puraquae]|jgi:outer membrane protein|uniref:Channel protein TolC n=1 Tax=Roseateles puraquae TaxID=431059 RepID=A0A254NAT0_9BURK|nr:TolC family outer membrane protein [Roseateles puraquae]MDG0857446.1 channel protein TolC [Roseateles puraquae]OWR02538.1 channel protein TolC [Roseateles puraquae]